MLRWLGFFIAVTSYSLTLPSANKDNHHLIRANDNNIINFYNDEEWDNSINPANYIERFDKIPRSKKEEEILNALRKYFHLFGSSNVEKLGKRNEADYTLKKLDKNRGIKKEHETVLTNQLVLHKSCMYKQGIILEPLKALREMDNEAYYTLKELHKNGGIKKEDATVLTNQLVLHKSCRNNQGIILEPLKALRKIDNAYYPSEKPYQSGSEGEIITFSPHTVNPHSHILLGTRVESPVSTVKQDDTGCCIIL
jgi:hypothetical protein